MHKFYCDLCGQPTQFPVKNVDWQGIEPLGRVWNPDFRNIKIFYHVKLDVVNTTNEKGQVPDLCGQCFNKYIWLNMGGRWPWPGINGPVTTARGAKLKTAKGKPRKTNAHDDRMSKRK